MEGGSRNEGWEEGDEGPAVLVSRQLARHCMGVMALPFLVVSRVFSRDLGLLTGSVAHDGPGL